MTAKRNIPPTSINALQKNWWNMFHPTRLFSISAQQRNKQDRSVTLGVTSDRCPTTKRSQNHRGFELQLIQQLAYSEVYQFGGD